MRAKGEATSRSWLVKYTALSQPQLRALADVQKWKPEKIYSKAKDGTAPVRREYPRFADEELVLGRYLGAGAFGVVHAVQEIRPALVDNAAPEDGRYDITEHEEHYAVQDAKQLMAKHAQRNGKPRYAVKRLLPSLSPKEEERGRADLAVEATLLSTLWHPNIIRMRGVRAGEDWQDPNFFIVLDCLDHTLVEEVTMWKNQKIGGPFCCGGGAEAELLLKESLYERLVVARDLASALMYLHENQVVYRDLKQGTRITERCMALSRWNCMHMSPTHSPLFLHWQKMSDLTCGTMSNYSILVFQKPCIQG